MATVSTSEFRKKLKIIIDGNPYMIVENQFVKPGKGQAFNRVKLKNMIDGRVIERTYKSGESVELADVSYATCTYLYSDGATYSFMDQESFETYEIPLDALNGGEKWLLENTPCEITFFQERAIDVEVPNFMVLKVVEAPPGVRGDTSGNVTRPAVLETGVEVQIPLFVQEGEKIKVDTRTGDYVERAKE
jgi:elongation factor P